MSTLTKEKQILKQRCSKKENLHATAQKTVYEIKAKLHAKTKDFNMIAEVAAFTEYQLEVVKKNVTIRWNTTEKASRKLATELLR